LKAHFQGIFDWFHLLDSRNCGEMNVGDSKKQQYRSGPICRGEQNIMYAWAMDAPELDLPKGKTATKILFIICSFLSMFISLSRCGFQTGRWHKKELLGNASSLRQCGQIHR
jgi:hypothetical protein